MALCSQVFSHTFHFSSGTHNKLWLDFVKGTQSIYADSGHNFRFMMYKTGTARMLRQGMGRKIWLSTKGGRCLG